MILTISLTTFKRVLYGLAASAIIAVAGVSFALAQESASDEDISQEAAAKIQFPVAELGGCADKAACKAYCDGPENRNACFGFAKKHGLMKPEKIRKIEKRMAVLEKQGGGPGGCQGEQECEAYCSNAANMNECIAFAKAHGVMDARELEEAEKVQAALASGAKLPGGCANKGACEQYCSNPDNMDECVAFAEQAGFMDKKELAEMKRVLPLMKRGETPGGCRARGECEAYCADPEHIDECIAFAEKAGLGDPKELEMMRKTGGRGPGGCRGKVECETYCDNPDHVEECFNFGAQHGLIPPEELERIQKAGGVELLKQGGPGGCRGRRQCDEFCRNPENQEACFQFAVEKGLIPPEEAERIKELGGTEAFKGPGGCVGPRECEEYCTQEEHQGECMEFFGGGPGGPPPGGEGGFPGGPPAEGFPDGEGEFQEGEFGAEGAEGAEVMRRGPPPFAVPGFSSPSGCRTPQECLEFCKKSENVEQCRQFAPGGPRRGDRGGSRGEDGEPPLRDEFPGLGEPTEGFVPPPGFGEGAPPHREEGFEVPPGFVPPGIEEGELREFAPPEFREETRERIREQVGEGVERRQEFRQEVRERAGEVIEQRTEAREEMRERVGENFERREEFREEARERFGGDRQQPQERVEMREPIEQIQRVERAGQALPPSPRPSPTGGEGEFRGGEQFSPPPPQPQSRGVVRRVLSTLMLIFGL